MTAFHEGSKRREDHEENHLKRPFVTFVFFVLRDDPSMMKGGTWLLKR